MSTETGSSGTVGDEPFELSAGIVGAESVGTAVDAARHAIETALNDLQVTVWRYPAGADGDPTVVSATADGARLPPAVACEVVGGEERVTVGDDPGPGETDAPANCFTGRHLLSVDGFGVVGIETTRAEGLSETDVAVTRRVITLLESALGRFDASGTGLDRSVARRLTDLITADEGLSAVREALSFVREHLDLRASALVVDDGTNGGFECLVDPTGTHRTTDPAAVAATLPVGTDPTDPTAVTTSADAPDGVRSYLATPVTVDGRREGTVWFAGAAEREGFSADDRWVLSRLAECAGNAVERRRRFERHERYEAVLEAVDDPVYALDADGRFTYVNDAANREFGHGKDIVGDHVSTAMDRSDVDRVEERIHELVEGDDRSATVQFEIDTADGESRVVEGSFVALETEGKVRGTAGVLRDVTAREDERRWYESFRQAIENAADGVAILDEEEYVYVDGTHVEMYGFDSREQLLGDTWRRLYDDDEIARLEAEAFPDLESTGHWRGRVTGSRPDGSTFPATLSLTVVGEGRIVCTVRDVTERETRRRELERRSAAIEASRDGVAILDERKDYVYVNQAHAEVYGYDDPEAFVGENWGMCYEEDERTRLEAEALPALTAEGSWRGTATGVRRDGSTFPQDVSLTRLEDGGVVCVVRDETDRRRRVEKIKARTERLDLVLESTGTGITEWDLDENVVSWDETLRDLTGRNPTCIEEFFEAVHPDDRERVRAAVGAMRETGEALTEEFRILPDDSDGDGDGDGDSRDENENAVWLETRVVATGEKREDDGGPTEALGTGTDVTERKRRRREARRNKRRFEQFAEAVPNGFFITAADYSELVNVNEAHAELTGVSRERLEEAPLAWLEYVVSEDRHRIEAAMQRKDDGEIEFPFEQQYRIDHPERGQRWLSVTIHLLDPDPDLDSGSDADTEAKAEDGENLAGVVTDITDQKRREERLESLHGATRRLLDVVERDEAFETAATAFDDVLGLNVVGFYKRVGDVLVRTAQTGTGSVSPPERVAHDEPSPLWTALDSGKPVVYDDVSNVDDGVDRGTVESAAYVPVGDHGVVAVGVTDARRLDGNEYRLIEVLTGNLAAVLDRVEREKSLAASEQRYRTLAENVPNGAVLLVDDDLEYVLATGELIEAFGLEESDVVGRPAGSLPVDGDVSIRDHYRGALDGESVDRRVSVGDRVLRVHVVPVERGNADAQVLVLVQDVTEEARRERELAEERERFQLLTESVDEYAFVALDEDGVVATWNDGASDLFGYDTETAVRTPLEAFYPTAKRESGLPDRLIEQARIAGESAYEGQHVRADGSTFHADVRYAFLETDEGESRGYAMIARDMTERRRQRRRTERFVEESDEVVAVSDPQGMFEYVSGSATRVLGYDPEALLGRNLFDFVHEDDREAVMETYFGAVDRPDGRAQTECRVTAATGEWRSVEVRVRNMCDNGAIGGMLVYLRDVTESKARARRFESVFNSTYQFTGLLDTDGTIREANEAILDFVGRDREAIVGTPLHEAPLWGDPDGRDRAREAVDRAARGEFVRYETEITGVDRVATVDVSVKPVTDDGAITALVAEGRDITARRRHRRHMQVLQRVLRHNIRNDVNKLEGWVQVLAEVEDPDERAMHVETVVEILEKWSSMTETVREIQEVLDAERSSEMLVDVATLVEGVVTSGQWPETTVESTVEEDLKATVPTSLRKAVTELVDNAVEASENPTVRIDASSVGTDGGRNWVELSVTDNGPGLPDMEAEVLHEGEETPLSHGTGLGLWMVRMLVEQAGGEISVDVTNTGTIVSLRLPDGRLPSDRA